LLDAETRLARAPDERQALDVAWLISAMPVRRSRRRWHELDALVIAHGFEMDPGRRGELSNSQGFNGLCLLHP